jgi:hypothetical protein
MLTAHVLVRWLGPLLLLLGVILGVTRGNSGWNS